VNISPAPFIFTEAHNSAWICVEFLKEELAWQSIYWRWEDVLKRIDNEI